MTFPYEDIVALPRPASRFAKMSMTDRGAQFSPFAALTGYDAAIAETGRLTEKRIYLDESEKGILDQKLRYLEQIISNQPEIQVTYFVSDDRKSGGSYVTQAGKLKKIDLYARMLLLGDCWIPMDDVTDIAYE